MNASRKIELLAPAGNWECARAAVENGADAIYFGLDVGFNARARAANFHVQQLRELMAMLHRQAVRGYVTLNTLVFTDELPSLESNLRLLAAAGVDAVLVQDLGVVRLIRQLCPQLVVHASTQMTLTNAAAIEQVRQLGIERVVLARELSIDEIRKISSQTGHADRSVRARCTVRCLQWSMLDERIVGRTKCQSRPMRASLPNAIRLAVRW